MVQKENFITKRALVEVGGPRLTSYYYGRNYYTHARARAATPFNIDFPSIDFIAWLSFLCLCVFRE